MCRPTTLDVAIINRDAWSGKLDNICGRYVGCFDQREDNRLCFYLVSREHPEGDISHLFVFYINSGFSSIQDMDVQKLKPYLPNIGIDNPSIRIGVVDVRCVVDPSAHLSIMIEAIDFVVGSLPIENYVPLRIITADTTNLSIGSVGSAPSKHCDGVVNPSLILDLKRLADQHRRGFHFYEEDKAVQYPGIGLMRVNNHVIGILYCRISRIVNYILIHPNQFENSQLYERIVQFTSRCIREDIRGYHCSRVCLNRPIRCDDNLMFLSIKTALIFSPHLLTIIKENDLLYLSDTIDELSRKPPSPKFPTAEDSSILDSPVQDLIGSNPECYSTRSELIISSQGSHFSTASDSTVLFEARELEAELRLWREVSAERRKIKDSIIPPVHEMEPFMDPSGAYLRLFPSYFDALAYIAKIWNRFAATTVQPLVRMRLDRQSFPSGARFIICPIEYVDCSDNLIIVDQVERDWIFLRPDNEAYKDPSYFDNVICEHLLGLFPELRSYGRRPVIMTSSFHKPFPRIHLLMSVYVIARLFRYSVSLPRKIIYGEWELRKYASNICSNLQLANSEYNIRQGLFIRGYLKEGAMISYASSLQVETAVVPKDQCMFCKGRGFKKLGAHYSMKHGGKAKIANESRLKFD